MPCQWQNGGSDRAGDQVRLFRRDPAVRWEYRVHEQLLPSLRRAGHPVHAADVVIEHAGYQDPAITRRKLRRNPRLRHLDQRERPDDAFVPFNLGWASRSERGNEEAWRLRPSPLLP
jgi:hypothetical protein